MSPSRRRGRPRGPGHRAAFVEQREGVSEEGGAAGVRGYAAGGLSNPHRGEKVNRNSAPGDLNLTSVGRDP